MDKISLPTILYEKKQRVARITLNRPEILNAANHQWIEDLHTVVNVVASDGELRIVVITGAGRAFCTGIDLKDLSTGKIALSFHNLWERTMRILETMDKIVIAGINGYCLGGGLQLALACDIRVASQTAILGLPAVKECLIPGLATYRLPRFVGMGRAKRLILTGENITALEAEAIGLVDWVVPPEEFEEKLQAIIQKFLKFATKAARLAKILTSQAFDLSYSEFLEKYFEFQKIASESEEHQEAMRAYREKREPKY
ncbi:MAG TPA: enoyl-CoA hydratase/isomerase family protein [Candidatus Limnocylindrales bacterium]|nr:enoyl-CoA hydratase/isomerase family protein [Candidatus Limnocylindrales bacterium]